MRILYLGPRRAHVVGFLDCDGDEVVCHEDPLHAGSPLLRDVEFLVSYGYRHILKPDVLERFGRRAINLHVSLLPWNRGADPNPWSFLEDTPKGVSIHEIDAGVDTGPLLAQREVAFGGGETLRTSYDKLSAEIEALFFEVWPEIRAGGLESRPHPPGGSVHRRRDLARYEHLLTHGWDTPVSRLIGQALRDPRATESPGSGNPR